MNMQRWKNRILALVFSRFPRLTEKWLSGRDLGEWGPPPWTPLRKPLQECRIALVTTAGVHLKGQEPFNMEDPEGDPSYRIIPTEVSLDGLTITHDYYDHRDADKDLNIVFPLTRLKELAREGIIEGTASCHYSFMGHIDGSKLCALLQGTAPQVARRLQEEKVDAVLLTPA